MSGLKIEVVDALFMTDGDHRPSFGCVKRAGFEVKFNGDEVIAMPDNVVWDLIAHELAHVVQYAWGITKPSRMEEGYPIYELPSGEEWYQGDLENHADDLISEWGFDPESIDNWSIGTGRTVVREVSLEEYMESVARFELTGWR